MPAWKCSPPTAQADAPHLHQVVKLLAERKYLSLMIEAGSKVNWAALESGVVDRILFYYAPKILGGTQSLPVAGGIGPPPPRGRHPLQGRAPPPDSAR